MNRTLVTRALAVLLALAAFAGAAHAAPEWGLKAGVSIAGVRWDNAAFEPESKTGFAGGGAARFPLGGKLYLQPEAVYAMKGFSYGESELTDASGNVTGKAETLDAADYLQVPVLLGYELPSSGMVRYGLYTGPVVSFELRERFVMTGDTDVSTKTDLLKNTDYGVIAGGRIGLASGPGAWELDVRFDHGFTQLTRIGTDMQSWGVEVLAGFTFLRAK